MKAIFMTSLGDLKFLRELKIKLTTLGKFGCLKKPILLAQRQVAYCCILWEKVDSRNIFEKTDSQTCRVYVEDNAELGKAFYLVINEDDERCKFYFTPPSTLEFAANMNARDLLDAKAEMLLSIQIPMRINNLARNLTLKLDTEWIDQLREMTNNEG